MTKAELIDALQGHISDDAAVHQSLLEAVQGFEGDTDKLEKELEKHIRKVDDGHQVLLSLANDL